MDARIVKLWRDVSRRRLRVTILCPHLEPIRASEKAAARIPESDLTPIIRNLDRYLLDRVEIARSQA